MAVEVQIVSTLDNTQTVKGMSEIEKSALSVKESLDEIEDALRNVKKESRDQTARKAFQDLNKVVDSSVLSIQELGTAADNYKNIALAAGKETPIGQEALQKAAELERQLDATNKQVANIAESGGKLNGVLEGLGAGVAVFSGITAAQAAFGEGNEEVAETLTKVTAAMTLLNSVQQIQAALQKESQLRLTLINVQLKAQAVATRALAVAQGVMNVVTTAGTTGLKLFRLALIGTGIGALVIGIGLLIANFDKVKKAVLSVIKVAFAPFVLIIEMVKRGLRSLGILESEEESARKARAEARRRDAQERIEQIETEISLIERRQRFNRKVISSQEKQAKRDIELLKAKGATEDEIQSKIELNNSNRVAGFQVEILQLNEIQNAREEQIVQLIEANKSELASVINTSEAVRNIRNEDKEFEIKIYDDIQKANTKFLDKQTKETIEQLQEQLVALNKARIESGDIRNDLYEFNQEVEIQETEFERKQQEKRRQQAKDHYNKLAGFRKKAEDLEISFIEDEGQRKIAKIQLNLQRELEAIQGSSEEANRLRADLEKRAQLDIREIRNQAIEEERELIVKRQKMIDEINLSTLEEGFEKERILRQAQFDESIAEAQEQGILNSELEKALKSQLAFDLAEIDQRAKDEELERERSHSEALKAEKEQSVQAQIQAESQLISARRSLFDQGVALVEKFAGSNEVLSKIIFGVQQGAAIANVVVDTIKANAQATAAQVAKIAQVQLIPGGQALVPGIIAQFSALKNANRVAAAGSITGILAASIDKFKTGGAASIPSGGGGGAAISAASAPQTNPPTFETGGVNQGQDQQQAGTNQGGGGSFVQTVKAFVLSGELTDSQDADKLIELKSQFQ